MNNLIKIALISSLVLAGCDTKTTVTEPTPAASTSSGSEKVEFAKVKAVIDQKCLVCHSATPKDSSFGPNPGGVSFDTVDKIKEKAARINQRAVVEKSMPLNNKTTITQEQRDLIGKWFAAGAPVQ